MAPSQPRGDLSREGESTRDQLRRISILAGWGAVVGSIVALLFGDGRVSSLAIGCAGGAVVGQVVGWLLGSRLSSASLAVVNRRTNVVLGAMSVGMTLVSILGYWRKGDPILLVGVLFFGFGAWYLFKEDRA
jgi:hypothetical protein